MSTEPEIPSATSISPRRGLAIASLVLGILAFFLSLVVVGILFGVVGLTLGLVHIAGRRGPKAMAWCGVALSVVGIFASLGLGTVYYKFFKEFRGNMTSMGMDSGVNEWEGVRAPDISVTTVDGKAIKLSELKGKRVVLDFWATWCGPCVAEIPDFIQLYNQTSRDELMIVGISKEDEAILKPFVKKKGVNYPIASAIDLPAPYKDLQAIPTTFFIDRKGVIQSVAVGARDFKQLKQLALAPDLQGEPQTAPAGPPSGLKDAAKLLHPMVTWSTNFPGAQAMCVGDWDGDGSPEILVATPNRLHVLGMDGTGKTAVSLPGLYPVVEFGRHQLQGSRLLGYSMWGHEVTVINSSGKALWKHSAMFGIDGAHWGDLDGDGTDELIAGMNGLAGLDALSTDGKQLWHTSLANVWSQAVIPAIPGRSALVFATEAGGTVRVFDGQGLALRTLRPNGAYCTKLAAGVMDGSNTVQILALGQDVGNQSLSAIAFDPMGKVAWSAPVMKAAGGWTQTTFACGDLDADGIKEWAFVGPGGALEIVTSSGEKLAEIPGQSSLGSLVIVSGKDGRGLLVTLRNGTVQAYSFQ